jgi:hypothetical protein
VARSATSVEVHRCLLRAPGRVVCPGVSILRRDPRATAVWCRPLSRRGRVGAGVEAGSEGVVDADTRWRSCYECAHGMLGSVKYLNGGRCSEQRVAKLAEEPSVSCINIQGSVWAMIGPGPWVGPPRSATSSYHGHARRLPRATDNGPLPEVAPSRVHGLEARNVKPCFRCRLYTLCTPVQQHRMH